MKKVIDSKTLWQLKKKMTKEELKTYYDVVKKSAHVFKNKKKESEKKKWNK